MLFFTIAVIAGILTVLAPCILPLLPIVIGTAEGGKKGISRRSLTIIASLSVSVIVFTLLLKATTLFVAIPSSVWGYVSGMIIVLVGLAMLFPDAWARLPLVSRLSAQSNKALGAGYQKKSAWGDVIIGASLGPVFTTCSPTYFFILATILPASFLVGVIYLLGFTLGMAFSLLLVAYFGQRIIDAVSKRMGTANTIKKVFAVIIILVGIALFTGFDKKVETWILDAGYGATINFEQGLIERFGPGDGAGGGSARRDTQSSGDVTVPRHLLSAFPDTDWSQADPNIEKTLSGGPGKDGIPAIDDPTFVPLSTFVHGDDVQAIVMDDNGTTKVYPYNILIWHEIVNDTVAGVPVAVTFCPLCGSAIVFDRRLNGEATTFGVSGSLIESNMIMYDRATESLWQQSTGRALAGTHFSAELDLVGFQLLTIGEVRARDPSALVLSQDTDHRRDYDRNPYAGYDDNERFIFSPSRLDTAYHPKEIFVIFRLPSGTPVGMPWLMLEDGVTYETEIGGESLRIIKENGELAVLTEADESLPFYFEMWFSYAVQHGEDGEVFDPNN